MCVHKIGGPGLIVEIDESQLARRKHQRGRIPREIWVFGALVRGSNPQKFALAIVTNRKRRTLERVIDQMIDQRSTIVSDGWGGYVGLSAAGFHHLVVNHSENFVHPRDPAIHTQGIENLWYVLMRFLRAKGTYTRRHLTSYLKEFMFRKSSPDIFDCFVSAAERHFLRTIAE